MIICVLPISGETEILFFENPTVVLSRLQKQVFENLRIQASQTGEPVLFYENRLYRDELNGAAVLLAEIYDLLPDTGEVILTPCKRGLPVAGLRIKTAAYKSWVSGAVSEPTDGWIRLENVPVPLPFWAPERTATSRGKIDLTVYPSFSTYLGNYDDRFKLFFQIMPVLSTTLWRGAAVYVEGAVPIYNDVNYQFYRFKEYAQISKAAVSQMARLPGDIYAATAVGIFNPNRWGISGEAVKLFWNRQIMIGCRFEYTGFCLYYKNVWNYTPLNRFGLLTGQVYAIGRITPLNLQVSVSYNRYVMKDRGPLFEVSRNFGENSVGVFAGDTKIDKFGGIYIKFPLARKKMAQPTLFRATLPRQYEYSYRATNFVYTQHAPIQTGISVYSGTRLPYLFNQLTPNYLHHNRHLFLKAHQEKSSGLRHEEIPESLWQ